MSSASLDRLVTRLAMPHDLLTDAAGPQMTTPPSEQQLCLACGLCCQGAIFEHVSVEDHEIDRLRRHLPLYAGPERHRFDQPCPQHASGCCQIYEERPALCEAFRCFLYKRVADGDLALPDALHVVSKGKLLAAELGEALGQAESVWRTLRLMEESGSTAPKLRELGPALLTAKLLQILLYREFYPPHERPAHLRSQPPPAEEPVIP